MLAQDPLNGQLLGLTIRRIHAVIDKFILRTMNRQEQDEARRLTGLVHESLDEASPTARQAHRSRTQYFRLFQALMAEAPGAMRRRFLLERSAWELGQTKKSLTDIALDAGYGSLEAFTRAFGKAYGISPSIYRRMGAWRIHLPAPNEFHYCGPMAPDKGVKTDMDLFDIFSGTDSWYGRRLLQHASTLSDEQLDRPIDNTARAFGWEKPDQNLREILERLVLTKEVWVAALTDGPMPPLDNPSAEQRTPSALLVRFEKADCEFNRVMREVRDRGTWDAKFVDALCEPPETFTFGGVFAHVTTFNAQRRLMALDTLHTLGSPMNGIGCPMEYEATTVKR
jgi:AraC-like DNA-binding protein